MAASTQPQQPLPPDGRGPGPAGDAARAGRPLAGIAVLAAVVAGSALLGVTAGFAWSAIAPRALLVVVSRGSANVVNPETSAFIAGEGWFAVVSLAGGIITGLLGYLLAVRRHGPLAMIGVLAGALAAALVARWVGEQPGAAAYHHALAAGPAGTYLRAPLMLGGIGVLAFWPLAAGLAAGGPEAVRYLRARHELPRRPSAFSAPPSAGPPRDGLAAAWVPPLAPPADDDRHPEEGG